MSTYNVTDECGVTRGYYAADGETACELHKEKFSTAIIDVESTPSVIVPLEVSRMSRYVELRNYAREHGISISTAIVRLVNQGLSHEKRSYLR